jgi:hypothetical protein
MARDASANVWQTFARDLVAEIDALGGGYCDCDLPECGCAYRERVTDLVGETKRRLWIIELDADRRLRRESSP